MIILDYLAYQHKEDWDKLGFVIVDAMGQVSLSDGEKIVIARPITGVTPKLQVYSEAEGADSSKLAPFAIREKIADIECVSSVEEAANSINQSEPPRMDQAEEPKETEKETADVGNPDVDGAFL